MEQRPYHRYGWHSSETCTRKIFKALRTRGCVGCYGMAAIQFIILREQLTCRHRMTDACAPQPSASVRGTKFVCVCMYVCVCVCHMSAVWWRYGRRHHRHKQRSTQTLLGGTCDTPTPTRTHNAASILSRVAQQPEFPAASFYHGLTGVHACACVCVCVCHCRPALTAQVRWWAVVTAALTWTTATSLTKPT